MYILLYYERINILIFNSIIMPNAVQNGVVKWTNKVDEVFSKAGLCETPEAKVVSLTDGITELQQQEVPEHYIEQVRGEVRRIEILIQMEKDSQA